LPKKSASGAAEGKAGANSSDKGGGRDISGSTVVGESSDVGISSGAVDKRCRS
jgi:hypothetical protein